MGSDNFSNIHNYKDIILRKELLKRNIAIQEEKLRVNMDDLRVKLGLFSDTFAKVERVAIEVRSYISLFTNGYRYFKEWRESSRRKRYDV